MRLRFNFGRNQTIHFWTKSRTFSYLSFGMAEYLFFTIPQNKRQISNENNVVNEETLSFVFIEFS